MQNSFWVKMLSAVSLFLLCVTSWVGAEEPAGAVNEARLVAQYNYSIHILATWEALSKSCGKPE